MQDSDRKPTVAPTSVLVSSKCGFYRCGHDVSAHILGYTVWGEHLHQCDDCDPGEMAGNKWHRFESVDRLAKRD